MPRAQFKPTDVERKLVEAHIAIGGEVSDLTECFGVSENTIRKYFANEIRRGRVLVTANVAQTLYQRAAKGDVTACIFWLKARAGWRDHGPVNTDPGPPPPFIVGLRDDTAKHQGDE